ncbi:hypothetical protein GCM10023194_54810 [Planotetraspora phitsanulokensis]|uniref:DUF998 domain-containing protein n=1 Tax=Planotetraspora phitsanulokensis TaxID=575192 RepID=A0A8J3XH99_9ACTN|nr:DUF998 domain-containing protein [Planotetraspora phitsanulokensis]GII41752.1 hypothetical protein Pph01_67550 [Planotetraspora phitsanulokensis]
MTAQQAAAAATGERCDPATSVTKTLLAYGVIAGPIYVLVSVIEGLTREGFDFSRHAWSLLANGDFGWIHIAVLVVSGLMTVAFAVGLGRCLRPGRGATWAPRLVGVYGASMVAAGAFRADPALGFPVGAPAGAGEVTWHGTLHLVSGGIGFACLIAACFVLGARFVGEGRGGWAAFSRATGVLFLAGFAGIASGGGSVWINLAFTAAIVLVCAWISAVALHLYRRAAHN